MHGRIWLAGLAVVTVGVMMSTRAAVVPGANAGQPAASAGATEQRGDFTADMHPEWKGDDVQPRMQLSLRTPSGRDHWGFGVPLAELQGLPPAARDGVAANVRFALPREAGRFSFSGSFDGGRGAGQFTFAPSGGYVAAMAQLGYRDLPSAQVMRHALLDVTTTFVRDLRDAGQTALALDDLTRLKIHGVSGAVVRDLASLGYRQLDADTLVRMRIHGASPEAIRGYQRAGLSNLAPDVLVRLRIHGVTPQFIDGLKTRKYTGLDADDLTRMRIHGVTLDEIDALAEVGMRGLDADALVQFRIHKVRPEFIREMRALGFTSADQDDFVRMRIHDVSAQFVRDARASGQTIASPDDAVDLAIHGRRWRRR